MEAEPQPRPQLPPTTIDEGIQAATSLRERDPEMGVVVISRCVSPHYALKHFRQER